MTEVITTNDEKEINLNDIKPADMIIFDGQIKKASDLIDLGIMILTKSTVTHGAVFMQHNPTLLSDAGPTGLDLHLINNKDPRKVHIIRINGVDDVSPVINAADKYLSDNLVYPMSNLFFLAAILIYKQLSHKGLTQVLIIDVLRAASNEMIDMINEKKHHGKTPMVCSEYVYQCYEDASKVNPKLALKLKNADMKGHLEFAAGLSLLNLLKDSSRPENIENFYNKKEPSNLQNSLTKLTANNDVENSIFKESKKIGEDLIESVWQFITLHHHIKLGHTPDIKSIIEEANKHKARFVTPNDLMNHLTNTTHVGTLKISRKDQVYKK